MEFCNWLLQKTAEDPYFPRKIMWTDEATFTRHGIFNQRNSHTWAHENNYGLHAHHFQTEFKVNVWMGMMDDCVIGPFFLPPRLDGPNFLHFLENNLPDLLEDMNLQQRLDMILSDGRCTCSLECPMQNLDERPFFREMDWAHNRARRQYDLLARPIPGFVTSRLLCMG